GGRMPPKRAPRRPPGRASRPVRALPVLPPPPRRLPPMERPAGSNRRGRFFPESGLDTRPVRAIVRPLPLLTIAREPPAAARRGSPRPGGPVGERRAAERHGGEVAYA